MAACRSCRAPIRWVETERGRRMPLDLAPYTGDDPRGLFVLREAGRLALAATPAMAELEPVYRTHFVTCPNAKQHRR
jgi:hypothetical protein